METRVSAGLLMYRRVSGNIEVLLGHPGGPFYEGKDEGCWSIPKGGMEDGETLLMAAIREFTEETGLAPSMDNVIGLGNVRENSGKRIYIWAFQGDCDTSQPVNSNLFELEWPKSSGIVNLFPELDKLAFYSLREALPKLEPCQRQFIFRLKNRLAIRKHIEGLFQPQWQQVI